jgi:hypothetical protein
VVSRRIAMGGSHRSSDVLVVVDGRSMRLQRWQQDWELVWQQEILDWNILVAVIYDGIGAKQMTVDCFIVAVATIALSKSQ